MAGTMATTPDLLDAGDAIEITSGSGRQIRRIYAITRIPTGCGYPRGTVGYVPANYMIELSNRVLIVGEDTEMQVIL